MSLLSGAGGARVCGVCAVQFAKYKCPRCAVGYCSLGCYRGHSEGCAEKFYEEEATRELKATRATDEQRKEMARTLRRFEDEPSLPQPFGSEQELASSGSSDAGSKESDGDSSNEEEVQGLDEAQRMALIQLFAAADVGGVEVGLDCAQSSSVCLSQTEGAKSSEVGHEQMQPELDETVLLSKAGRSRFRRLIADGSLAATLQTTPCWWEVLPQRAVVPSAGGGWCVAPEHIKPLIEELPEANAQAQEAASAGTPDIATVQIHPAREDPLQATDPSPRSAGVALAPPSVADAKHMTARSRLPAFLASAPSIPNFLPAISSLTPRTVPSSMRFTLLEQLVSYAHVVRLHCGCPTDDPPAAAATLLYLSATLSGRLASTPSTAEEALLTLAEAENAAGAPQLGVSPSLGLLALTDAAAILADTGGGGTALALSAIMEVFLAALGNDTRGPGVGRKAAADPHSQHDATSNAPSTSEDLAQRGAIKFARRKAAFVAAWWRSLDASERRIICESLRFALQQELRRRHDLLTQRASRAP